MKKQPPRQGSAGEWELTHVQIWLHLLLRDLCNGDTNMSDSHPYVLSTQLQESLAEQGRSTHPSPAVCSAVGKCKIPTRSFPPSSQTEEAALPRLQHEWILCFKKTTADTELSHIIT